MPVFARTKLTIEADCMEPRVKLDISYSGPNPDKIYPKILEILEKVLAIPKDNIQEKEYAWNRSKIPEEFSASIDAIKDFDRFTYMLIEISLKGKVKPSKEFGKEGSATITIHGIIRTEYPQDTLFQRSIIYQYIMNFYHKMYYQRKFEEYRKQCREAMFALRDHLKAFFEILPK